MEVELIVQRNLEQDLAATTVDSWPATCSAQEVDMTTTRAMAEITA